ncbi:unnamed protein product [Notodromas monacha]|uniref:Transmembrane protein 245 n=1 Tax=Notodromas monacha TaxID=399045 RepID=A0A7R9GBS5_9CRUS|nr:unnamed protein product [Notodromas monacha]CAG0915368.1 unnamed protein product [Notodromas monacha]
MEPKAHSAMDTVLTLIPASHGKAVRSAFYNTVAFAILGTIAVVAGSVYLYVLQPYLRPLLWAGLCGSVLHPAKERLATGLKAWISVVQESRKPAVFEVICVPFVVIDGVYEAFKQVMSTHYYKCLITTVGFSASLLLYYLAPEDIANFLDDVYQASVMSLTRRITAFWLYVVLSMLSAYYLVVLMLPVSRLHPTGTLLKCGVPLACVLCWGFVCLHLSAYWLSQPRAFVYHIFAVSSFGILPLVVGFWNSNGVGVSSRIRTVSDSSSKAEDDSFVRAPEVIRDDLRNPALDRLIGLDQDRRGFLHSSLRHRLLRRSTSQEGHSRTVGKPDCNISDSRKVTFFTSTPRTRTVSETIGTVTAKEESQRESFGSSPVPLLVVDPPPGDVKDGRSSSLEFSIPPPQFRQRALSDSGFRPDWRKSRPDLSAFHHRTFRTTIAVVPESSEGNLYLVSLLWVCVLMTLWRHPRLLQLLPIPVIYLLMKHLWLFVVGSGNWGAVSTFVSKRLEARKSLLVPFPIPLIYGWILRGERAIIQIFKEYVDSVAAVCIIFTGIVLSGLALIFISVQVYHEGVLLVSLTGQALNSTIVGNFLGSGDMAKLMHQSTDSIHHYGRVILSSVVRKISGDVEDAKLQDVEEQVLAMWNKFYVEYNKYVDVYKHQKENYPREPLNVCDSGSTMRTSVGTQTNPETAEMLWAPFSAAVSKIMPGSMPMSAWSRQFNATILMQFLKNNVDLMQSIASIVASNLYLAVGGLTALLGLLAGGGNAVLNFVLNWLIFCTTLFYLLKCSSAIYKPLDFFFLSSFQSTKELTRAFDRAISDVFVVSCKLAAFYALWTWILHDFFDVKLVFIPSAIASILAVVPLFGSYLVCIPGAIELWAVQKRSTAAVVFFIAHLVPPYFVNDAFYRDIRGDMHPYLTSLAVMGGVLCLGVEGAIFGPLLLCLLLIVYQTFQATFRDVPLLRQMSSEYSTSQHQPFVFSGMT